MSTFDSTKTSLPTIIQDITEGKIQLPDFQRGWVWDDEHVRSLLVSIARSFPVGAVMLLDTGGEVRFQVRPVENVAFPHGQPEADQLILDGQQRLTSLTQVLALDRPVKTFNEKKKPIERYYYIDIALAMEDGRLDEAIFAVDSGRQIKSDFGRKVDRDLSTRELECTQMMFPCREILNSDSWEESLQDFAPDKFGTYMSFRKTVLSAFRSYLLPVIALGKETSKEAVCLVFEKVNTGGVPLTVFELITASFAADGFNLRDDWFGSRLRKVEGRHERLKREKLLEPIENTDFIQAITLLHTLERRRADIAAGKTGKSIAPVSAKRVSMLSLALEDYRRWADRVEAGFGQVGKFLKNQCFFSDRDIPYRTQLVPLAAVMTWLGEERWREPRIYDKLCRWFWCGVLGELYGGAVETRVANDLEQLLEWFEDDNALPRTVYEANFQENRLATLRSRNSAAYKGLNILVLRDGAKDFFWKSDIQELEAGDINLDIHHIFPRKWCEDNGIDRKVYDGIANKTPISAKANRMIGGKAPSAYIQAIQSHKQVQIADEGMDEILQSHRIDPELLRDDDFAGFVAARTRSLLDLVEAAMGKEVEHLPEGIAPEAESEEGEEDSE
ncbi:DUF262 domain-containing protein [Haloferula sp. A504]|uniref:GmrSD restriction endonuclease domain-containing protein n=1 Tax=Haloferula sp. A504 TaxID=3373601 RepID=UPI0031C900F1|nr:DUF262 domain-containing protein [Verrucomicrobiaceae bacterium E54]